MWNHTTRIRPVVWFLAPKIFRKNVSWPKTHVSWPKQNDRDRKIRKFFGLRRQKVKVRGSPETRFGQVSGQSEPSSGGKRTFKVCKNIEKNCFRHRKMKRRESPETHFGKVSSQSEPSSGGKRPFEVWKSHYSCTEPESVTWYPFLYTKITLPNR